MRFSTLVCVALTATTLQPVASLPTPEESGGKGWLESLLDKSSQVANAIYEELDSLATSAHNLYDGLHFADAGEALWDKVSELGPNTTDGLFRHAMELYPSEKITEFKGSMYTITGTATTLHQVVLGAAEQRGIPHDSIKEEFGVVFKAMFEDLKEQFPPPGEAPSHENRTAMIGTALNRIEESFYSSLSQSELVKNP